MSGIAGILTKRTDRDLKGIVKTMSAFQSHRGPDGDGLILDDKVCFGHCFLRLNAAPRTPSEPLYNSDKSILITSDANIYNSEQIRRTVTKGREPHGPGSDAETILSLYEDLGINFLKHLRGDFSFAIWDKRLRKLFLVRDRFGIKPLFYFYNEKRQEILFASELRPLIKSGMVEKDLDLEGIYHYLFLTFFPQPRTPLKYIRSLLPGSYLLYDFNKEELNISTYWDIPCADKKPSHSEEEIIEECSRLLEESIRIRCPENVPVGISLSSGMDSCSIAALTKKFSRDVITFTFGFEKEHEKLNEFSLSKLVAEQIGSNHHEVCISSKDIIENLSHLASHLDTPTAGAFLPYFFGMNASQEGIRVAFRGDGGNSAFQYLIDKKMPSLNRAFSLLDKLPKAYRILLYANIDKLFSSLRNHLSISNQKILGSIDLLSRYFSFKGGTTHFDLMFSNKERKSFFASKQWQEEGEFKDTNFIVASYYDANVKDLHEKYNYGDFKVYCDQGLPLLNSVTSAFSIDLRLPYFDHVLIEFIQNNVPSQLRIKDDVEKYMLKRMMNGLLPAEIIDRNPRGFYQPMHHWLRTDLRTIVDDVFSKRNIENRNIFNYQELGKVYNRYYEAQDQNMSWRKVWTFVTLEYWLREHYDS